MTAILVVLLLAVTPLLVGLTLAYILLQEHPAPVAVKVTQKRAVR